MHAISQEDLVVWNTYIDNLYKTPEHQFTSKKVQKDEPDIIDLHGMTIQQAFHKTNSFLRRHFEVGNKLVTVITGKGGQINKEFLHWCNNIPFITSVEPLTDSRGQAGAYLILLKKKR